MIKRIINFLSEEAEKAASAGHDSIEWYATIEGSLTDTPLHDGYYAEAYFDGTDPSNPGWAYRITPIVSGERQMDRQESGSLND